MHIVAGLFVAQWRPRWSAFSLSSPSCCFRARQRRLQPTSPRHPPARRGIPKRALSRDALTGRARVIDGDTIELSGRHVRLEGIDAPEIAQTCGRWLIGTWPCGTAAGDGAREAHRRPDRHLREPRPRQVRTHARRLLCRRPRHQRGDGARRLRLGLRQILDELRAGGSGGARAAHRHLARQGRARVGVSRRTAGPARSRMAPNGCAIKGNVTAHGPHLPHAVEPPVRQDPDRRGERQALVLHGGRGARRRLAPGRRSLTKHLQ